MIWSFNFFFSGDPTSLTLLLINWSRGYVMHHSDSHVNQSLLEIKISLCSEKNWQYHNDSHGNDNFLLSFLNSPEHCNFFVGFYGLTGEILISLLVYVYLTMKLAHRVINNDFRWSLWCSTNIYLKISKRDLGRLKITRFTSSNLLGFFLN